MHCPAISTVHAVLDRHRLVTRRSRRSRRRLTGTPLSWPATPNRLWCADYKGEFLLGNRRYCYRLPITDFASRYLLACEALSTTKERYAFTVFERAFQENGLPEAIRTDNGVPFASAHALYGLSKLAVWWLRLGIGLERIAPGHPEQNGRHERLHLTLKTDATRPSSTNVLQQQARFDTFVHQFNHDRECRPMATVNLTARYLDLLKPQRKRYEVFDTIVPGFAIRVTPAGHKSFTLYYRHHGRIRRVGLGRYPDILLADARKAATQHRGRIFDGADPAEEKKAERATNGDTVGALFDLYKTHREKAKSWTETRRIMEREVLPAWRHIRVVDLKRRDGARRTESPVCARDGEPGLVADLGDAHVRDGARLDRDESGMAHSQTW